MISFRLRSSKKKLFLLVLIIAADCGGNIGNISSISCYLTNGTDFLTFIPILLDTDGDGKNDAVELSCSASLSEGSYKIECYFMDEI